MTAPPNPRRPGAGHFACLPGASLAALLATALPLAPLNAQDTAPGARTPPPEGVTPQTELAIERGLRFLVRQQGPDGSWVAEGHNYPVAMTALAGMALLS